MRPTGSLNLIDPLSQRWSFYFSESIQTTEIWCSRRSIARPMKRSILIWNIACSCPTVRSSTSTFWLTRCNSHQAISNLWAAVTDVTAAKQAGEALRRSESYLAEAQRLTHTGSGAWSVPGWDALYLSEEWYRIYGFDPKQGLSAWKDRLQRMHPEDQAKVQEAKDRATKKSRITKWITESFFRMALLNTPTRSAILF
jgi:PAS domain-containing protein